MSSKEKKEEDSSDEELDLSALSDSDEEGEAEDGKKKKRGGVMFRMKKGVAGKVATSSLGRKTIKKAVPKDMRILLGALKVLVEKVYNSKKQAATMEKNIIRLLVKGLMQAEKKNLTLQVFCCALVLLFSASVEHSVCVRSGPNQSRTFSKQTSH